MASLADRLEQDWSWSGACLPTLPPGLALLMQATLKYSQL